MKKVINFLGQKFVYEGELKNELPEAYENQFRKHGWFPRSVSKDKIEFELKLIEWKKKLKLL